MASKVHKEICYRQVPRIFLVAKLFNFLLIALMPAEMGLLNLEALTSQLNLNAGFGHQNEMGRSSGGSRNDSGNGFGGHVGPLSNHHQLHNGILGLKSENSMRMQQQQSFFMEKQHQQHQQSKDWQDGLRALLPNVNVSFGALPHTNGTDAGGRMFQPQSQGLLNEHQHPHERMQRHHQQHRSGEPLDHFNFTLELLP